jgi:hypothetical protein
MDKKELFKLVKKVKKAAGVGLQTMPKGIPRTAKQICGAAFWNGLTKLEKLYAGRALKAMVDLRYIGLDHYPVNSPSNHRRYTRP